MFFDSNKNDQHELEIKYTKLHDLYEEKEKERLADKQEIEQLSKKLRSWIRKYHKLELSFVEEEEESESDELKQLQALVLKLNKRNKELEQQLADKEGTDNPRETIVDADWDESQSIRIDLGLDEQPSEPEITKEAENVSSTPTDNDIEEEDSIELEFSPRFQAILEKHAEECSN